MHSRYIWLFLLLGLFVENINGQQLVVQDSVYLCNEKGNLTLCSDSNLNMGSLKLLFFENSNWVLIDNVNTSNPQSNTHLCNSSYFLYTYPVNKPGTYKFSLNDSIYSEHILVKEYSPTIVITGANGQPNNETLCGNNMYTASIQPPNSEFAYVWKIGNSLNSNGPSVSFSTPNQSSPLVVEAMISRGNCMTSIQRTLSIVPSPTAAITIRVNGILLSGSAVCGGTEINLTASPSNLNSYQWSVDSDQSTLDYLIPNDADKLSKFGLTVTNNYGCSATAERSLSIYQSPSLKPISIIETSGDNANDGEVCMGAKTELKLEFEDFYKKPNNTFMWSDGSMDTNRLFFPTQTNDYNVIVTRKELPSQLQCTADAFVNLTVLPTPLAKIEVTEMSGDPNDLFVCIGAPITLTASPDGAIYSWNFTSDKNRIANLANGISSDSLIRLIVNVEGCEDTTEVDIRLEPDEENCITPDIPDIVTPNGDGFNDDWKIHWPEGVEGEIFIYNRFGFNIWHGNNTTAAWLSTSKVVDGTYFYFLKYRFKNGGYMTRKGTVLVIGQ